MHDFANAVASPATKRGADAPVRTGPPGPALPVFEQVDQGVDRGPGGPPHKIVARMVSKLPMTKFLLALLVPMLAQAAIFPDAIGAGAASRRSLGTAVFGGMNAATLLAVFIVPVLYVVIQRAVERKKS